MKINGVAHCLFEQSGTFKNEFKKLGINAYDYDIQNNFNETDFVIDLFNEIDNAYQVGKSIFDNMTKDDIVLAFYPCIYFCEASQMNFTLACVNYRNLTIEETIKKILQRSKLREEFYERLIKLCYVCEHNNLRLIIENPWTTTYLKNNFIKSPDIIDDNRLLRGDYFKKPTAYWFFNCKPTNGYSYQFDKIQKTIRNSKSGYQAGICSEERSMISKDYARNFICDFILGKHQEMTQVSIFDIQKGGNV